MSITIRLALTGKKHQKSYRLVVMDTRSRRQGKPLEVIGYYYPREKPPRLKVNKGLYKSWLEKGAIVAKGARKVIEKLNIEEPMPLTSKATTQPKYISDKSSEVSKWKKRQTKWKNS